MSSSGSGIGMTRFTTSMVTSPTAATNGDTITLSGTPSSSTAAPDRTENRQPDRRCRRWAS